MPSRASKVNFFFDGILVNLQNRRKLKKFIDFIFENERKTLESINYIFCTDRRLLQINREFLKHDYYTDIITFRLSEGKSIFAEVYISIDRVRVNAVENRASLKEELHRVIFHGVLHLCGYRDKKATDKRLMRMREDFYLGKYLK
jgi:probable rRNA maturation factor